MSRKPEPLNAGPPRKRCPVCGQVSYSFEGIHPQCAARQSDTQRVTQSKAALAAAPTAAATKADLNPWHTTCPKCHAVVHIRRKVCECGQALIERQN